jgi:hypothetical protein
MPVILASWETEIGGSQVHVSPGKSWWEPTSTNSWVWWHASVIPAAQEAEIRRIMFPSQSEQKCLQDLLSTTTKKSWT